MDLRAAKLALARKKLKDHQVKKNESTQKEEILIPTESIIPQDNVHQIFQEPEIIINQHKNNIEENQHIESYSLEQSIQSHEPNVNVTEILISQKRNLEMQINQLQNNLNQLEKEYAVIFNNYNVCQQKNYSLESEFKILSDKMKSTTEQLYEKDKIIIELKSIKSSLSDQHNSLLEQLEFTKTMLTTKETENASLHSQLANVQNQLEVTRLQLQQLTNGINTEVIHNNDNSHQNEILLQKIATLEQQLKGAQKEKDQISMHYEHYVNDLNKQLKSTMINNENMSKEIQTLSNRESSLIEQISDMEIRLQNYNVNKAVKNDIKNDTSLEEVEKNYIKLQESLQELKAKYEEIKKKYLASEAKVIELSKGQEAECKHDNISIMKLNADIASDKLAAQRATEQNKKLKSDMQNLEEAYVKMSSDKLELTEKLAAEKYLNRELTIKLAEIDEKSKEMYSKLMAKDEEMIRLQNTYRTLETEFEKLSDERRMSEENLADNHEAEHNNETALLKTLEVNTTDNINKCTYDCCSDEHQQFLIQSTTKNDFTTPNDDAMLKLQDRFLKIMKEVADLSDEKHRLEHIIMQLQNETDTICEYVALYQQQRSLLKKRDDERSAQIKIFQEECNKLKNQIEELSDILTRFAEDKELISYFQEESKRKELQKVTKLILHIKNNCLIDPEKSNVDFKNFYPCNCCSGKLIEV
ncbi:golgin subfamily A member 2 [Achroia grisella]|uniref:golgin subfamily A member 2 n=1 Tax=Achroia grisella TaxID=688607 RepID=UPI0027D3517B|nr:golgin subfamily A member 2 [Achroia grisella]